MTLNISKILDEHLPSDGVGTEREQLRMNIHREISNYADQQVAAERERIKKDVNSWCDEMWTITTEQQERLLKLIDSL